MLTHSNSSSSNNEEPGDNNGNDNPFLFLSERFQEELQLLFPDLDKEKKEIAKTVSREFDLLPPEKQNFPYLKKRLTNQFEELEIRRREERHRKEKQRIQSERRSQINSPVETPPRATS